MQRCTRCGKEGPDEQAVCLRCGGNMGPLGGPIYTNVHRQTGVTIVDFERYNMGYKDKLYQYLSHSVDRYQWAFFAGKLLAIYACHRASMGSYVHGMCSYRLGQCR